MINLNKKKIAQTEEFKKASENLPEKILIGANISYGFTIQTPDMDFLLVPYNSEKTIGENEVLFYNHSDLIWGNVKYQRHLLFTFDEICKIYVEKIPCKYDFIDIYLQSFDTDKIPLKEFVMIFHDEKNNEELFSYSYQPKEEIESIFCGTLGRVSNGWKFYPVFKPYEGDMDMILEKYNLQK